MAYMQMEKLSFCYRNHGQKKALEDITLQVQSGETIGLIGANGAGKSTLLKLLVGLQEGYEGALSIDGVSVMPENFPKIREKTGYVFQDSESQLFMSTVYEDVAFAPRSYGYGAAEVRERVEKALEQTGILGLAQRPTYTLSGGEKKLAAIAGILTMQPGIILMDEPAAALDPGNRRRLIRVLNGLSGLKIIASHDLDLIADTCERVVLLSGGKVAADASAEQILTDRALLEENSLELPLTMQSPPWQR